MNHYKTEAPSLRRRFELEIVCISLKVPKIYPV
ncbi:MAG: hypothetical protein ACJAQ2_001541, partial [Vicingaceae bacterium]